MNLSRFHEYINQGQDRMAPPSLTMTGPGDAVATKHLSVYDEVKLRAHQLRRVADSHE